MRTFQSLGNWYATLHLDDIYIEDSHKLLRWHPGALIISDVIQDGADMHVIVSFTIQANDMDDSMAVLRFIGHRSPARLFADLERTGIVSLNGYPMDQVMVYRRVFPMSLMDYQPIHQS